MDIVHRYTQHREPQPNYWTMPAGWLAGLGGVEGRAGQDRDKKMIKVYYACAPKLFHGP